MKPINAPWDEVKIGDRVRSYDFVGVDDCYAEGVVEDIGEFDFGDCKHYKIKVDKYVLEGQEVGTMGRRPIPDYVFPPTNGTPTWLGRVCKGVKVIK